MIDYKYVGRSVAKSAARIYIGVLICLFVLQRSIIYQPSGGEVAPANAGLPNAEVRELKTPDGERVVAWYVKAAAGKPTIISFHGNGGNLAMWAYRYQQLTSDGLGLFAMSYRGYSGSSGSTTEANNVADAVQAYDTVKAMGVPDSSIVVLGHSLGSGVAVQLAGLRSPAGLILEAPYSYMASMANRSYPMFPTILLNFLLKDKYESNKNIAQVKTSVLILHGEKDQVINVEEGRALAAAAPEPKTLKLFPEGQHENLLEIGGFDVIRSWLAQNVKPQGSEPAPSTSHHLMDGTISQN